MAASVDSPSPAQLNEDLKKDLMASPLLHPLPSSSPLLISPASDKRFWSTLRSRIDTLLENHYQDHNLHLDSSVRRCDRAMSRKEDSLLLLRGFDSVTHTLSQLSNNLDNALQGAKRLAEPPTLAEIFKSKINNSGGLPEEEESRDRPEGEEKKGLKRKFNSGDDGVNDSPHETEVPKHNEKLKKAKNMAISLANKAASLARELKSLRSDLSFMQERCVLLEEENRRLRDGVSRGIRLEEDDLMRLQMEVLLAEKSRLANENANLVRENQCLHQLVEYHQLTTQDLSASYEHLVHGMRLDFSSPSSPLMEEADYECDDEVEGETCRSGIVRIATSLDDRFDEEQTAVKKTY